MNPRAHSTTISGENESEIDVKADVEAMRHGGDESLESARHTTPMPHSIMICVPS